VEPKVGSFCWLELGTSDQTAAKKFYSNLFGWTAEDVPMAPDMTYTMFRQDGNDIGGAYRLMKEQVDAHVPPHWMLYVKVESVDASAAKRSSWEANKSYRRRTFQMQEGLQPFKTRQEPSSASSSQASIEV
jgi:predicted enzyme related to lactoylglutathione lyase